MIYNPAFTSSAKPADLLITSMIAGLVPHMHLQAKSNPDAPTTEL